MIIDSLKEYEVEQKYWEDLAKYKNFYRFWNDPRRDNTTHAVYLSANMLAGARKGAQLLQLIAADAQASDLDYEWQKLIAKAVWSHRAFLPHLFEAVTASLAILEKMSDREKNRASSLQAQEKQMHRPNYELLQIVLVEVVRDFCLTYLHLDFKLTEVIRNISCIQECCYAEILV